MKISGGNSAFYGRTDIAALIEEGRFRPLATTIYPFEEAAAAQQRCETGHPGGIKLVLTP